MFARLAEGTIDQVQLVDLDQNGTLDCLVTASGNVAGFQRQANVQNYWTPFSIFATNPVFSADAALNVRGDKLLARSGEVLHVFDEPTRDEMFHAARGQGAWLNDRRLQTSTTAKLDEALLATGFPPDLNGQERTLEWWRQLSLRAQSLRRTGSTASGIVKSSRCCRDERRRWGYATPS